MYISAYVSSFVSIFTAVLYRYHKYISMNNMKIKKVSNLLEQNIEK